MKRFVAAVAIVTAAVVGGLVVASPAQAGPAKEHYAIITADGPAYDHWFWIDEMEGLIGCNHCYLFLNFSYEEHPQWQGGLMDGLDQLSEASVAADERTKAALQAQALESFTGAARALDGTALKPGPASAFDPDKGRAFAIDAPWLDAAQADISEGISLLQAGFCDPKDPQPWARRAMEKFNKAFTEIATKKAI
jgi:hypothetical protein